MTILGIDPGKSGAVAVLDEGGELLNRLRCIQGLCQMTCSRYRARELISLTIKGRRGPPLKPHQRGG
jgi:hypothetical protein